MHKCLSFPSPLNNGTFNPSIAKCHGQGDEVKRKDVRTHVKYERHIIIHSKVMPKLKLLRRVVAKRLYAHEFPITVASKRSKIHIMKFVISF